MREARTPLKSLEELKVMFQRLSFSPFTTMSTPQMKSSPRGFTSRLFIRGKSGSLTFPTPTNNSPSCPNPGPESYEETSSLKVELNMSAGRGDPIWADPDSKEALKEAQISSDRFKGSMEDQDEDGSSGEDSEDELLYEAESPDEAALVHAARAYHCTLRARSPENLLVELPGIGSLPVRLLHVLPFDSNRKRMSVVVRHPLTGEVVVYTKGADSVIMDLAERPKGRKAPSAAACCPNTFLALPGLHVFLFLLKRCRTRSGVVQPHPRANPETSGRLRQGGPPHTLYRQEGKLSVKRPMEGKKMKPLSVHLVFKVEIS